MPLNSPANKSTGLAAAALLSIAALTAAVLLRTNAPLNHDVSWLIVAAQRLADGGQIGVDIYELNAPGAIALYVPAVWLKSLFVLPTKLAVIAWATIVLSGSLALSWRLLHLYFGPSRWRAPAMAIPFLAAIWALLPGYDFAQREHFIIFLTMPYVIYQASAVGRIEVHYSLRGVTTLLMAFAVMVKPFFVLLPLCSIAVRFWILGIRAVLKGPEIWIFGVTGIGYVLAIYIWAPDWFRVAQEASVLYRAYDGPWRYVLRLDSGIPGPSFLTGAITTCISGAVLVWYWRVDRISAHLLGSLLFSAAIFLSIYLLQRKGFHYHLLPITSLSLTTAVLALAISPQLGMRSSAVRLRELLGIAGMAGVVWIATVTAFEGPRINEGLREVLVRRAHAGPVYGFTTGMRPMFPLVTELELSWASRFPCFWTLVGIYQQRFFKSPSIPQLSEETLKKMEDELAAFVAEDFSKSKPATVVIDTSAHKQWLSGPLDFVSFFSSYPAFANLWRSYEYVESVGPYEVWVRSMPATQAPTE